MDDTWNLTQEEIQAIKALHIHKKWLTSLFQNKLEIVYLMDKTETIKFDNIDTPVPNNN